MVEHKWNTYVQRLFLRHVKLDIAMFVSLTLDTLIYRSVAHADSSNLTFKAIGHLPMAVTTGLWYFFARHEFRQVSVESSFRSHISDTWNALDFISLFFIFAAYIVRVLEWIFGAVGVLQGDGQMSLVWSTSLLSVALPVTYLNTLYYMQGFDEDSGQVRSC